MTVPAVPAVVRQRYADYVPFAELTPHPANPNVGDIGLIAELLQANGFAGAILAQERTGVIIDGEHRMRAAEAEGMAGGPVLFLDVDDDERDRLLASLNESARRGANDEGRLVALLGGLAATRRGLAGTAFTGEALDALIARMQDDGGDGDGELGAGGSGQPAPFGVFDAEQVAAAALTHFRAAGFPYRTAAAYECMLVINRLAASADATLPNTDLGYAVADSFHPARFSVPCMQADGTRPWKTPVQAFASDKLLARAIGIALEDGRLTPGTLAGKLALVSGTRAAANFRPGYALSLYRRFCPPGGTVLDCSAGFGGRLTGFLASQGGLYIGIDPLTCPGNAALAAALGMEHRVELIAQPAEDVDPARLAGRADFAFTSPPYFAKERYADDEAQSWRRYPDGDGWRAGFLEPMMRLTAAALKPGAPAAVNIADVTLRGVTYPLAEWAVKAGQAAGLTHTGTEAFPLGMMMGRGDSLAEERSEPVLLFRKEAA